jgi:hypothetical protein
MRVGEPKSSKNRMHFDIETPEVDAEVARLEALGAHRLVDEAMEEHGSRWIVMADPEATSSASATPGRPQLRAGAHSCEEGPIAISEQLGERASRRCPLTSGDAGRGHRRWRMMSR